MVTIGVDPDSRLHGVAVYEFGKLIALHCITRNELVDLICTYENPIVSIENVLLSNAVHSNKKTKSGSVNSAIARKIGCNQQAQYELMCVLDRKGIGYMLQKPASSWKGDRGTKLQREAQKKQFKLVTGWDGKSNSDTRSAAYMGFLALKI